MADKRHIWITPNQITGLRLGLAVLFFVILGQFQAAQPVKALLDWASAIFIVAGLTDVLDGYLARRFNLESSIGRILDPFVDKVLTCGAFIFFAGSNFAIDNGQSIANVTGVAPWMVAVIISRELLVTGLRGFSEARGTAFAATVFGKIKMFLQTVTVVWIMLSVAHYDPNHWVHLARLILIWSTVIFTAGSMLAYLGRSRRVLAEADNKGTGN